MKCDHCNKELIQVKGFGYVHPKSECEEKDGLIIDEDIRYVWNKKYPAPKEYDVDMIKKYCDKLNKEHELVCSDFEFYKENYQALVDENVEAIKVVDFVFENKLLKWWYNHRKRR